MRLLPPPGVDVLFASYGGGHVAMLRPVALAVAAAGHSIGFLGLTTAQADLERYGHDYFGFSELQGAEDEQVQAWGRQLAGPDSPNSPVPYAESVAYHGLSFRDLVVELGEDAASEHYRLHGRQGFLPVMSMQRMLEALRPRLVVASNSPRAERALFIAAGRLGMPALCLVDLFAVQEAKWITKPDYADVICVLNDKVRAALIEKGGDPGRIEVTGNPAFDTLTGGISRGAGVALRSNRGFTADDKVILWASNVEPARHPFTGAAGDVTLPLRIEEELRRLVRLHPDWQLVIRHHPSEVVNFEPEPRIFISPREEDLHTLLHAVDVVVVMSSTVGLEAHLAGKPVISVDLSVFTADAPYSRMGISTGVADLRALEDVVLDASASKHGPKIKMQHQGSATDAVSARISDLLRRPNL